MLIGCALRPSEGTVGAGGAVSALIGVHLVELIQAWKLVYNPFTALLKLLGAFSLFIIAGFLPQVSKHLVG